MPPQNIIRHIRHIIYYSNFHCIQLENQQLRNRRSWRIRTVGASAQLEHWRSWRIGTVEAVPAQLEYRRSWSIGAVGASRDSQLEHSRKDWEYQLENPHSWSIRTLGEEFTVGDSPTVKIAPSVRMLQLPFYSN